MSYYQTATVQNHTVSLPAKILLSKEGVAVFEENGFYKKTLSNKDGSAREGLESSSFQLSSLEKLIMSSYVEEIFVSLPELLSRRKEILSINHIVVNSVLYKKINPSLGKMFFESGIVKEYNRKNPKFAIVDLKSIPGDKLRILNIKGASMIEILKKNIFDGVNELIFHNHDLSIEEKSFRTRTLSLFLDKIDIRIWYLFYIISHSSYSSKMKKEFCEMIDMYLENTQIGSHLGNLVMEFIQNAEKEHFLRLMAKLGISDLHHPIHFLMNEENRKKLIHYASRKNQMLEMNWKLLPERNSHVRQNRILINISNFGLITEAERLNISRKMKTNVEGISMAAFYQEGREEGLGAGLGLLYNSYLEDFCKKRKIQYSCHIYPEPLREKTTVRMELII